MKRPDKRQLEALARLNADPRYVDVLRWFQESLEFVREQNDTLQGFDLTISQGKAQNINIILKDIREAEGRLDAASLELE